MRGVVVVSSVAAVVMIPKLPKDQVLDETYWSDKEYCSATDNWYCLAITAAEILNASTNYFFPLQSCSIFNSLPLSTLAPAILLFFSPLSASTRCPAAMLAPEPSLPVRKLSFSSSSYS
ncbi:hypothetical protein FRX31_010654 [Thalictrum thalictroides]|uniref:Uncharacterized protein n=1 Tax=Thalictrum thalictroides TaxID=46969 RepID=A0A7J6WSZ7_THATH|nr:hypothetical protein FRX31_010654 [Thalictrum thalictroides]